MAASKSNPPGWAASLDSFVNYKDARLTFHVGADPRGGFLVRPKPFDEHRRHQARYMEVREGQAGRASEPEAIAFAQGYAADQLRKGYDVPPPKARSHLRLV